MAHGRGNPIDILAPRSQFYQGPFGRICPDLPPWSPPGVAQHELDQHFLDFANANMVERPGLKPADLTGDTALIQELDNEFGTGDPADPSTGIPAAYTYFGQFIDHDITFDTASDLQRQNDPNAILNFRTPRFDLDNLYGRGKSDQPYMFSNDGSGKFLIGKVEGTELRDLPRNSEGRALIGDMRNDENSMVSQLQVAFLLAHNTLVDRAVKLGLDDPFNAARKSLRWLYQWIVWNDFLKRVCNNDVHACALKRVDTCDGRKIWELGLKDIYNWKHQPFIPVEFSAAAYRFGHSMVRNAYQTNITHRGFGNFAPIFDNTGAADPDDLRGFRKMKKENVIQWDWFLKMNSSGGPFPQRARRIDTKLANALSFLHEGPSGDPMNVLAFRNLKRGWSFGLPSATDVAHKLCLDPIELTADEPDSLWYYILREAESLPGADAGQMLGRLGSVIVCATFAGLLKGDPNCYVNIDPCWTPDNDPLLCNGSDNTDTGGTGWELSSIIRIAGLPVSGSDVDDQTGGTFPDTTACV